MVLSMWYFDATNISKIIQENKSLAHQVIFAYLEP